jgi:hypothetical protein
MDCIMKALMKAEAVYVHEAGGKLHALQGAVVRYIDGKLSIGGIISSGGVPSEKGSHLEAFVEDGSVCFKGFDVEVIHDNKITYVNATTTGTSKVIFATGPDAAVRIEMVQTL